MLGTEVPIDSLIREMKRGRSYTLGLGRATPLSTTTSHRWPTQVAHSLHGKTQRNTLLIETDGTPNQDAQADAKTEESPITKIVWTMNDDTAPPNASLNRQAMKAVGALPKWKEQYPLIILHLGALDSLGFSMLGRLCDGIALAADMSRCQTTSLRDLSRTLRLHQSHGCRLLGMWSVEIG
ncbi:MAG: hypothetical protein KGQ51_19035 [Planctomycetes bacterium]|nr:hypothetical protein [Planctomycetota bacterium]